MVIKKIMPSGLYGGDRPAFWRKVEGSRKYRRERAEGKKPSLNWLILSLESSTQQLWANDACHMERGRAIGGGIHAASSSEQWPKL